ncbi:flavodoxin-dependent (E)-4-hydroxy-3-methylbut-2-enyl-diphosphate synthase [Streptomyces formicae]|uniref:flavodoxin-dependent (E)-4-hydroxy-3-methylbut-2-enyl-diphosphate synthase n=1 Tax=Streptomyces formicae TaxID=1616117 RepID=UPI002D77D967|nr:flavodoxin-dependent (E)-4-hydroxy-3-methylbut-2-enyl-diphosphate synthase [Streptomyces formicae]
MTVAWAPDRCLTQAGPRCQRGDCAEFGVLATADIYFQPRFVFAAIDAGCAAVRYPGNITKLDDRVADIAEVTSSVGVPIRIGVNTGSPDPRLLKTYSHASPRPSPNPPCGNAPSSRNTASGPEDRGQTPRPPHHDQLVPGAGRALRLPPPPRRHRD